MRILLASAKGHRMMLAWIASIEVLVTVAVPGALTRVARGFDVANGRSSWWIADCVVSNCMLVVQSSLSPRVDVRCRQVLVFMAVCQVPGQHLVHDGRDRRSWVELRDVHNFPRLSLNRLGSILFESFPTHCLQGSVLSASF